MQSTGTGPNSNCILGCYDGNNNLEANDPFYSDGDLEGAPAPITGGGWPAVVVAGLIVVCIMGWSLRMFGRFAS